jgi:hypothetical protein
MNFFKRIIPEDKVIIHESISKTETVLVLQKEETCFCFTINF